LEIAADSFGPAATSRTIFVMSNGIQTAGSFSLLDFELDKLAKQSQIDSFVSALKSQSALPDLGGAQVFWYGLGVVDQVNQPDLETRGVQILQNLWTSLIKASNGKISSTSFNNSIPFDAPLSSSIQVSAIDKPAKPCFITIREDDGLAFLPDKAKFISRSKAQETARQIAIQIGSSINCQGPLQVTGYTASGVAKADYDSTAIAANRSLSLSRAKSFIELLLQAGVTNELIAKGGGKGPIYDWNPDGTVNSDLQKQNRIVTVSQ
jgi:flagellar motor protein MotB